MLPLQEHKLTPPPKETPACKADVLFGLPPSRQGSISHPHIATIGAPSATLGTQLADLGTAACFCRYEEDSCLCPTCQRFALIAAGVATRTAMRWGMR